MRVGDIIYAPVITVSKGDKIRVLKEIYLQKKITHLIVVEDNKLLGFVSIKDLYAFIAGHWNESSGFHIEGVGLESKISSIVNTKIITLNERDFVAKAINSLSSTRLPCLPVVDDFNKPIGLLTYPDVIQYLDSRLDARTSTRIA